MIKNKVLSIFLLVLGVFFLNIPFVVAKEDIEIRDVRIVESNEGFTVDNLNFEKNNIHSSNVVFENVNDFVTYEIEFENNSDEDYVLKSIDSNIKNDNINMESDGVGTVLGKNSTKLFRVKYEYNKELQNQNNITLNDISFRYNFNSTKELVNPLTKNNLLIILSILLVVGIVTLTVKSKKKALLLFLLVLIPVLSNAEEGYSFNMLFDDVEIKGRFLDYEVNVYDNGSIIDSYNKQYGQEINDLPNVRKDGYDFDKWIDQDNNIINNNTVITKDLDINSKYAPIEYNISYDLKDGELDNPNPTKYTIEDDFTLNNPRNNNTFSGWNEEDSDKRQTNYEFNEDKGDKSLIANFSDNPEVDYTVIHRKQNAAGTYDEYEREELKCAAHTEITPLTKKYAGYISPVTQTKEISEDGLTTFTYDYSISQYSFNITNRTYINSNSTLDGNYNYKKNIIASAKNRAGYSFKWSDGNTDYDRNFELTSNTTLTPIYTPNTDIPYKVVHKIKSISGNTFEVKDENTFYGTVDTLVTPKVNYYEGFISPEAKEVKINGDGSTVVEYLYTRNEYSLTIEDADFVETTTPSGLYVYGTEITVTAKERPGYTFVKWSNEVTNPTYTFNIYKHTTIKPIYSLNDYKINFDYNGGTGEETLREITPTNSIGTLPTGTREGYYLDGWYTEMSSGTKVTDSYIPSGDMTMYARWNKSIASATISNEVINIRKTKNETINITNANEIEEEYTFTSNNESIATVDSNGKVTGVAMGTTTITIKGNTSNHTKTVTVNVLTNEYGITFNANGGTISSNSKVVIIGEAIGELPTGTREGYYLDGWYTSSTGGTKVTEAYVPEGNEELFARWKKSVASANISNSEITIRKTKNETINITNKNEIEETYTFTSNNTNIATVDSNGKVTGVNIGSTTITIKGNKSNHTKTVTVNVITNEYIVTFDANGGTISQSSKVVTVGESVGTLPTGTKEGYYLDGWYTAKTSGDKITTSYTPEGDVTIYAHWKKSIASAIIANQTIELYRNEDKNITISNANEIEEDYTFTSNNESIATVNSNGKVTGVAVGTTTITIKGNKSNATKTVNISVVLREFTITFDANGGTPTPNNKTVTEDQAIGTLPTVTKEGYYFDGWYTESTNGEKVTTSYVPTSNKTLHARWKKSVASMTISNEVINIRKTKNETINITNANEIEEEYTFTSNDTSIATVDSNGKVTGVAMGTTTITVKGNTSNHTKTVTINVLTNEYAITFNANGGTISSNSKVVTIGEAIGELPTGTKEGYYLDGWYTSLTNGVKVTEAYVPENNTELFAIWKKSVASMTISNNSITIRETENADINITNANEIEETYTFTSNDTSIATVNSNGRVTGVEMGTTTITITGNKSNATQTVTVNVLKNVYNITFNSNGGTISQNSKEVVVGEAIGELPTGTKTGYYLDGWYTNLTDGVKVTEAYIPEGNIELTAKWKKSVASANISNNVIEVEIGQETTITITNANEIEEEYTFTSSNTGIATVDETGKVTAVAPGPATITITGTESNQTKTITITVPANEFTITFNANGGTVSEATRVVQKNAGIGAMPTPTGGGGYFSGWLNEAENKYYTSVDTVNKDMTLKAVWKSSMYKARIKSTYYSTVQSAINAAKANDEVVVLRSVSEKITNTNTNSIKLNLDRNTITGQFTNDTNAKLTLLSGTLRYGANSESREHVLENRGTLVIGSSNPNVDDGTNVIYYGSGYNTTYAYAIKNDYDYNTAPLTINKGNIKVNSITYTNRVVRAIYYNGPLTINGGTIETSISGKGTDADTIYSTGTTEINGGTIISTASSSEVDGAHAVTLSSKSTLTMSGGELTSTSVPLYEWANVSNGNVNITINGGTINGGITTLHTGTTTINGGNINGSVSRSNSGGTIIINGGHITPHYTASSSSAYSAIKATNVTMTDGSLEVISDKAPVEAIRCTGGGTCLFSGGTINVNAPLSSAVGLYFYSNNSTISGGTVTATSGTIAKAATLYSTASYTYKLNYNGGTMKAKGPDEENSLPVFLGKNTALQTPTGTDVYEEFDSNDYNVAYLINNGIHITLEANGGEGAPASVVKKSGEAIGRLPTPKKETEKLVGWYTGLNDGYKVESTDVFTSDITLYARYTAKDIYRVTFEENGGSSVTDIDLYEGASIGTLPTTSRSNYKFDGWYLESNFKTQVTKDYIPTQNTTIYAKWIYYCLVTYNANGGTVSPTSKRILTGNTIGTLPTPTRDNYIFTGWYSAETGGDTITSGYPVRSDVEIFAGWREYENYEVTFDKNNENATGTMNNQSMLELTPTNLNANQYTVTGYGFLAWNTERDGSGTSYSDQASITITGNTTLYAQWKKTYEVTFDKNDSNATGTMNNQAIFTGTATALNPNQYTLTKAAFVGWNTERDGSGTSYLDGANITITNDITLYAQWLPTYTLTFDKNNEDATGTEYTIDIISGATSTLPTEAFYRYVHNTKEIDSYNNETDGSGNSYGKSSNISITSDTTIYAQWVDKALQVGEYFSMTPDITTTTSEGVIPSELNFWRVVAVNQDGTVDAVSEYVSSNTVTISGGNGYVNYIDKLNKLAAKYAKENYTESVRMLGYDGQTPVIQNTDYILTTSFSGGSSTTSDPTSGTGSEVKGGVGGDTLYLKDYLLVKNVYGNLIANKVNTEVATDYWIASRKNTYYNSGGCISKGSSGRIISTSGSLSYKTLSSYSQWQGEQNPTSVSSSSGSYAVRPIITLKTTVSPDAGQGIRNNPYTLKAE